MKKIKINRRLLIVVLLLLISIIGGTYAWFTYQSNKSALVLSIADLRDSKVIIKPYQIRDTMSPVATYTSGVYSQVQVINSSTSNKMVLTLYYIINSLNEELINNGLKYTIVSSIEENGEYTEVITGDFTTLSGGNELTIFDTKINANTTVYYRVYLWLDSNYGNQVIIQNSSLDIELNAKIDNDVLAPVLDDGMIPVTISNDGTVTTILKDNDDWYNYQRQEWANIVLVSSSSRSNYLGTEDVVVQESDILGYYVWIPRYRYKIWTTGVSDTGQEQEINIIFESENTPRAIGTMVGTYRTHPAFLWDINSDGVVTDSEILPGIWVGKFETTGTGDDPTVLPNVESLRSQNVSTQFQTSLKFAGGILSDGTLTFAGNDIYGLTYNTDSHMAKNSEWGAVAYLSRSKYGINDEIRINNYNNSGTLTGCGALNEDEVESTTCGIVYGQNSEYPQSTTGNITGIYDMSGGANEFVMGVLADLNGNPQSGSSASSNSGFNGIIYDSGNNAEYTEGISFPSSKYYDLYTSISETTACNGGICYGHSLSETYSWYSNFPIFVSSSNPWLARGGYYNDGIHAGVFYLSSETGEAYIFRSWRSVLVPLDLLPSTLTVSSENLSITYAGSGTGEFAYTYDGDGIVSCSSSDTSVATCSVDSTNKKVTVTALSVGNSTITLSASMGVSYNVPESKTVSVTVSNQTYTISYNACSGSGAPSSQTKTYGESLTLSSTKPTREGYTFVGWSTSEDGCSATSATYGVGDTYTNNSDATMYAIWKKFTTFAIYSSDDNSLTFYNNGDKDIATVGSTYNGKVVTAVYTGFENSTYNSASFPWYAYKTDIKSVKVENIISPVSTAYWFYELNNCSYLDLEKMDTSKTLNMSSTFYKTGYDVSSFNIVGLDNWDVSKVTYMTNMFYNAGRSATTWIIGDLSSWNVSSVTNMSSMFNSAGYNATTWNIGDLSGWNVSSVKYMTNMFYNAGRSATTFNIGDLNNWNVSSVTNISWMFSNSGKNATTWIIGDLSSWDVSSVTNISGMFSSAGYNATTWNIGNLGSWNVSKVTNMSYMFSSAGYNATTFDIGNLNNWDVSSVTDMSNMFYNAGYNAMTWSIGNLNNWNVSKVTNMYQMFSSAGYNATTFDIGNLNNWNVSSVTDMSYMFTYAGYSATTWSIGDLGGWNVSKVTNMCQMFNYAGRSATTFNIGDLNNWNVSSVTNMSSMFSQSGRNATTWSVGNLSSWNVSSVTNMSSMFNFAGYSATTWIVGDLSGWDVSSVTDMSNMFYHAGYSATYTLDLSGWNVSSVTSYSGFNSGVTSKVIAPTWVN